MQVRYSCAVNENEYSTILEFYKLLVRINDEFPVNADFRIHAHDILNSVEMMADDMYFDLQNGEVSADTVLDYLIDAIELEENHPTSSDAHGNP